MLCREIIAVCSEIHTKHINALCGQKVEFASVKPGGTYKWPLGFKGSVKYRKNYSYMMIKPSSFLCELEVQSNKSENYQNSYLICFLFFHL